MNASLIQPYLVQRGNFVKQDHRSGIDKILSFDYMGSSEFEYGALPISIRFIRDNLEAYSFGEIEIKGIMVEYFCADIYRKAVLIHLLALSKGNYRLKEFCDFELLFRDSPLLGKCLSDFWWTIDSHWMWWIKQGTRKEDLKQAIYGDQLCS